MEGLAHVHGFENQGCSQVHATRDDLQMFCNPDGSLRAAYSRFGSPYTALIAALSPPRRLFLSWNPTEVLVSSLSFPVQREAG